MNCPEYPEYPAFECGPDSCATMMSLPSLGESNLEVCVLLERGADSPTKKQIQVVESLKKLFSNELLLEIADVARSYCRYIDDRVGLAEEGVHIDETLIQQH